MFALLNIITLLYAGSAIPANVGFNLLLVRKLMRTCPRTAFLISLATSVALFTPLACGNGAFFRHIYIPWYLAWWFPPAPVFYFPVFFLTLAWSLAGSLLWVKAWGKASRRRASASH